MVAQVYNQLLIKSLKQSGTNVACVYMLIGFIDKINPCLQYPFSNWNSTLLNSATKTLAVGFELKNKSNINKDFSDLHYVACLVVTQGGKLYLTLVIARSMARGGLKL
jgi:hypothetical protein